MIIFKKYGHFKTRLDEKDTGWVSYKKYIWEVKKGIMQIPTEFGSYGNFRLVVSEK